MPKIGIDARLLGQTGVGVYLDNLLYFLEKNSDDNLVFYIYLLNNNFNNLNFKRKIFVKRLVNSHWHSFSEQIKFLGDLEKDKLDLMHFTYFSFPIFYKRKFISTIHDTTPLLFKTGRASTKNPFVYEIKHLVFRLVLNLQVRNAEAIVTPSETVKTELVKKYGKDIKDKIYPIYEGVDRNLIEISNKQFPISKQISNFNTFDKLSVDPEQSRRIKFLIKNYPFIIYVGNFYPHKNVERLIKAFSQVKEKVNLILIGPDDFFADRLGQLIKQLKQSHRILFFHNPTKKDMVYFYRNALALVHPSLSEGFGLPLIEAVYFNLPVIASDIPVFREILDGQYIEFNPYSLDDMVDKINNFLKEKKKFSYNKVLEKYSFEKMTMKTLELYKKILNF